MLVLVLCMGYIIRNTQVSVIPHKPLTSERGAVAERGWLLKLHGCVTRPEEIVLSRDDYMAYDSSRSALAGIVQAMMLTKHMLFVGFSLVGGLCLVCYWCLRAFMLPMSLTSSCSSKRTMPNSWLDHLHFRLTTTSTRSSALCVWPWRTTWTPVRLAPAVGLTGRTARICDAVIRWSPMRMRRCPGMC